MEQYAYDALGRRIQKGDTYFLYIGDEEIAVFQKGVCKELKVGEPKPIAIEIDGIAYAPVVDVQGTIRQLIHPQSNQVVQENNCDVFGLGISTIPYAYAGKRYDPETGLIYFGKRFYDPNVRKWITPDPFGPIDHANLYQYVFNNPLRYQDPTGASVGGYLIGLGEIVLGGVIVAGALTLEVATVGGFTVGLGVAASSGFALMSLGLSTTTYHAPDMRLPRDFGKNIDLNYLDSLYKADPKPAYDGQTLGTDPSIPPDKEFEWKGKGKPGSKQGSWYNPSTGESLHPDLDHPPPIKPHWDYEGPNGEKARLNVDGTWEWK